jgi:DNA-binding NtrC family response regulator
MAGARVLVVDDDSTMLNVIRRILTLGGYEVLTADGPRQALEIVRNRSPVHLVLSDVLMPEMQGTQLVREVWRLSPQTVGVLMTGYVNNVANVPDGVALLQKALRQTGIDLCC